jgi:hypothetical protein
VADFIDRDSFMMLEYEKVLSDCLLDGILRMYHLICGRPNWHDIRGIRRCPNERVLSEG